MLKIILVQGFWPLRIKITQFPGGFLVDNNAMHSLLLSQCNKQSVISFCRGSNNRTEFHVIKN